MHETWVTRFAACAVLLMMSSCAVEGSDAEPRFPPAGHAVAMGEPLTAVTERVSVPGGMVRAVTLPDGSILVESELMIHRWRPDRGLERDVAPNTEVGELRGAAHVGNALFLAGPAGIVGLTEEGLYRPPLHDALVGHEVVQFEQVPGAQDVWVLTDRTLFRWRDGLLEDVAVSGLRLEDNEMTFGLQSEDGWDRLYIRDGEALFLVEARGPETRAVRLLSAPPVASFDVDVGGGLWVCDTSGGLHRGDLLGAWYDIAGVTGAEQVRASRGTDAVWVRTADALYYGEARTLHSWVPEELPSSFAVSSGGVLVAGVRRMVFRASARHRVWLRTLEDGEEVFASRRVRIATDADEALESVEVHHAGARVAVELMNAYFDIEIDPEAPVAGRFPVEVWATFGDGTLPVELSLHYAVPGEAPRWEGDVGVIADTYCVECHGAENAMAGARHLETRQQWVDAFDQIQYNVTTGNMPKAPRAALADELVRRIVAWGQTGFAE